ncbi:hypothetical protein [Streptomyces sp. NPDC015414]|uniref:hypothetical protein n=1 Tax=Streptomyces sp. NPDC015414 TaxID=3364957 RepID=UPI0036F9EC80
MALAIALVVAVVNWLLAYWLILAALCGLGLLAGGGWIHRKRQQIQWEAVRTHGLRYAISQLDALHHSQFEDVVRDLMRRDGCPDAVRNGGGGDVGATSAATSAWAASLRRPS